MARTLAAILARPFGTLTPSLSVAEMSARGWADRSGRVLPRWTHAGAGSRSYDVAAERADMEAHAPALPPPDLDVMFAQLDLEHSAWERAEGLQKYGMVA